MKRSEEEFYESTVAKVLCLIEMWHEEQEAIRSAMSGKPNEPKTVGRFSELLRGAV